MGNKMHGASKKETHNTGKSDKKSPEEDEYGNIHLKYNLAKYQIKNIA